jgi:serine/threonine protein kinase
MGPEATSADQSLEGTQVGHFQILRRLSSGGMGTVYEGRDQSANRRVAIKVLHREIAQHRDVTLRFINEARALNVVHHPNLVRVIHLGKLASGIPYLVMEYLDGVSLGTRLREADQRLSMQQAIGICVQAAGALLATHEKGIVHRDIKPDNIMVMAGVGGEYVVKLFDFGIAKLPPEHMSAELTFLRTQTGQLLGTPYYMAPEQCRSDTQITEKVDVYALGTVLFCCLAGRTPFVTPARGDAAMMHLCAQQIADPPPLLSEFVPAAAPPVVALLDRLLAKNPDARPSMKELHEQLLRLQAPGGRSVNAPTDSPVETATVVRREVRMVPSDAAIRPLGLSRSRRFYPYLIALVLTVWFIILLVWSFT